MTPLRTSGSGGLRRKGWKRAGSSKVSPKGRRERRHRLAHRWFGLLLRHHRHDPQLEHRAVATTVIRSPAHPASVMGDSCRQVSWLAAKKRITPAFPPIDPAVALGSDARRLQLRGQPRFCDRTIAHRVPFSPLRPNWDRNETVTPAQSKQCATVLSIAYVDGGYFQLARWRTGNAPSHYFTASLTIPSSSASMAASASLEAAFPRGRGRR
jgi:hypothetical protein